MDRPVVVAEVGINHQGNLDIAKRLVALSAGLGADYVKFQKRDIESVYTAEYLASPRQSRWGTTQREQKEGLEFGQVEYDEIDRFCKLVGIGWYASVWDPKSVAFVAQYNPPYMKLASACITDHDILKAVKATGIPVVMSCGMSTEEEVDFTMSYLGDQVAYLLHCVASYPTPTPEMSMSRIGYLKERYGKHCQIGFSNHSPHPVFPTMAYLLGADMLEFHITLDKEMEGSDQAASLCPVNFARIFHSLYRILGSWGEPMIRVMPSEVPIRRKLRKE